MKCFSIFVILLTNGLFTFADDDGDVKREVEDWMHKIRDAEQDTKEDTKEDTGKKPDNGERDDPRLPLPTNLEGVQVNYQKSKICVKQGGKERCTNKKDVPGLNAEVVKLFRVVHEFKKLSEKQKDDDRGDESGGGGFVVGAGSNSDSAGSNGDGAGSSGDGAGSSDDDAGSSSDGAGSSVNGTGINGPSQFTYGDSSEGGTHRK